MSLLAGVILIMVVLVALWGAVQLSIMLIIGAVIYLCVIALIDQIKEWLEWP